MEDIYQNVFEYSNYFWEIVANKKMSSKGLKLKYTNIAKNFIYGCLFWSSKQKQKPVKSAKMRGGGFPSFIPVIFSVLLSLTYSQSLRARYREKWQKWGSDISKEGLLKQRAGWGREARRGHDRWERRVVAYLHICHISSYPPFHLYHYHHHNQ